MAFERFTEVGRAFRPRASIRSTGQIGFNHGSVKRFELDRWPYVVLFFDREAQKIGIKLTKDENETGAVKLTTRSENSAISARSFLDFYSIEHSETKQYDLELDGASGMLIMRLK